MHGEKLAVLLRSEQGLVGPRQLGANQQRFQTADDQKKKSCDNVPFADFFVIDSRDPPGESGLAFPNFPKLFRTRRTLRCRGDNRSPIAFDSSDTLTSLIQSVQVQRDG